MALTSTEKSVYIGITNYAHKNAVLRYKYPAGGNPTQSIAITHVVGLAVTPGAKP
jgi:hypothetical protein